MKLFVLADFEKVLDYFARCLLRMAVDLSRIFGTMASGLNLLYSMKLHGEGLPHWTDPHSGDGLIVEMMWSNTREEPVNSKCHFYLSLESISRRAAIWKLPKEDQLCDGKA